MAESIWAEAKSFFVLTQQDVIPCPGLIVQPFLDPSVPINNHVTYNCAVREARGSRSTLYPPFPPFNLE